VDHRQSAPKIPEFESFNLSVFEGILRDMSDIEDILELLSEYYSPAMDCDSEESHSQVAILESWKNPKAKSLGAEKRADTSTLNLGAVIVEVNSDGESINSSPATPGTERAGQT